MPNFLKYLDGSGRKPRQVQVDALTWLDENWHTSDVFAIQAPVATGKSMVAKSIQNITGAAIITPANILIDQYVDDYKKTNYLKGKSHYQCSSGLSCSDWMDVLEQPACPGCPYKCSKDAAIAGKPTFYNPLSFYYAAMHPDFQIPEVMVIDEADQLNSFMLMMSGKRFRKSVYKFTDKCASEVYLVPWIGEQLGKLRKLLQQYSKLNDPENAKKLQEISREIETVKMVYEGIKEDAQNYAIYIDYGTYRNRPETFLNVKPIRPPKFIVERFLCARKTILMSGTLLAHDIADLTQDRPYKLLDLPSPIPKERRPIYWKPVKFKLNYKTDPKLIVEAIEEHLQPGVNTIIHTTYGDSKKWAPLFRNPPIVNQDSADKISKVEEFKQDGGVFLASGCAEGIDLKGKVCELNIIPKLPRPNLADPSVKKRVAADPLYYDLATFRTLIQQCGRSTRTETDFSRTVILDPMFMMIYRKIKHLLPQSFCEAIVLRSED